GAIVASTSGKIELETLGDGTEDKVLGKLVQKAVLNVFNRSFSGGELDAVVAAFQGGFGIDVADTMPSSEYMRQIAEVRALQPALKKLGEGGATAANIHLVTGSGPHGKRGLQGTWYAIGDFIQPYKEYIRTRALPKTVTRFGRRSLFTEAALVTFEPGVVLNVGRAAPLN